MPLPAPCRAAPAAALFAAVAGLAAAAEAPMSPAEFERYTTGKTLTFFTMGRPYGQEDYREGRRVVWSFLDGECKDGTWYAQGNEICFVYEGAPVPQCWLFYREAGGLRAVFQGDDGATELYEAGESEEPMICHGPEVGV